MKKIIIDNRLRKIEKNKLSELGYELIEILKNNNIYEEISSHVDIFACLVNNKIIVEKNCYKYLKERVSCINIIEGNSVIGAKYPEDIRYNVCIIGKKAIHNFNFTDEKLKDELIKDGYELINTNQGYTNCSIAVIDENSAIVTDKGLYKILKYHGIDVLCIDYELDIKLILNKEYSKRRGFIGGAISKIGNNIIIFGDLKKIDKEDKIRKFIEDKNLNIIDFEGIDVIDYGGIIEIK